ADETPTARAFPRARSGFPLNSQGFAVAALRSPPHVVGELRMQKQESEFLLFRLRICTILEWRRSRKSSKRFPSCQNSAAAADETTAAFERTFTRKHEQPISPVYATSPEKHPVGWRSIRRAMDVIRRTYLWGQLQNRFSDTHVLFERSVVMKF